MRCERRDAPFLPAANEREALQPIARRLPPGAPVGPDWGHLKGQRLPRPEQRERAGPLRSAPPPAPGRGLG